MKWVTNRHISQGRNIEGEIFIVGDPQATEAYTKEQLAEMGMIGLYKEDGEKVKQ